MPLLLEKVSYCPSYRSYETRRLYHRFDPHLWKCLPELSEEPSTVELKADLGRYIVANLSSVFKSKNHGRFVAVTFSGKILTVCNTLETLNNEIAKKKMKENYYIARIGYNTIAQL